MIEKGQLVLNKGGLQFGLGICQPSVDGVRVGFPLGLAEVREVQGSVEIVDNGCVIPS